MNVSRVRSILFLLAAAVTLITAAFSPLPAGYVIALLLVPVGVLLFAARTLTGRYFYLLCSSGLLVIACATVNLLCGLFLAWVLAGLNLLEWGMLEGKEDIRMYLLFCGVLLIPAAMIHFSNHVLLPLVGIGAAAGLVIFLQTIRNYQLRKLYRGAPP
jgi:hypothetical protein